MSTYQKTIDGRRFTFTVKLQTITKYDRAMGWNWLEKVIDVTDGVGFGPASSWVDAFEFAREMAADKSEWRMKQLKRMHS